MRGRVLVTVLAFGSALAAPDARAVEVILGWDAATRWDSNVLNSSDEEQDDFSIRTGPLLELHQRQGDVTGRLRWSSLWEGFLDTSGADNFEHFVDLDGAWQIDARNQIRLSNSLARTDSITSQLVVQDTGGLASPGQGVRAGTESVLRNQANLTFAHQLSPLLSLEASVDNSLFEFEDEDDADGVSTRAAAQVLRTLTPRMAVGVGAAFTRQDFDDSTFSAGSGADIIEVFGIWNYQITPTLVMSTSLGPALNRPDEIDSSRLAPGAPTIGSAFGPSLVDAASCPALASGSLAGCAPADARDVATGTSFGLPALVNPQSVPLVRASFLDGDPETDDALTLFGAWSLRKQWDRSAAELRVQRRTSAASGNGISTDLTLASASFTWRPERKWELRWTAGWTLQTSASDFPITALVFEQAADPIFVDNDFRVTSDPASAVFRADGAVVTAGVREAGSTDSAFESTSYQAQFVATRQISRRLTARGRLSFFRFDTSGDLQADRTTDSVRVEVGVRWTFDPIRL